MPESGDYLKCACQNCAGHLEVPSSGLGVSIVCPHCRRLTTLVAIPPVSAPRKSKAVWLLTALLLLLVLAGLGLNFGGQNFLRPASVPVLATNGAAKLAVPPPTPAPDPWHGLKAGPVTLEKAEKGSLVYAVGTLRNASNRERFGIKVEVDVFDAQNQKLGSATDYAPSLVPGKEWRFKALVLDRKTVRAELAKVTEDE